MQGIQQQRQNVDNTDKYKLSEQGATRQFDLNVAPEYWKTKFLYPFALDKAPLRLDGVKQTPMEIITEKKRQKILQDESILHTQKYQFPANQIKKVEYLHEIQKPISFSLEDIKLDLFRYTKEFKKECIPHISENNEIVDTIHNYPKAPKTPQNDKKSTAMEHARPTLKEADIETAKKEIQLEWTARMVGLLAHLTYWNTFGQFNKMPLDMYHRKQLFVSIAEIKTYWEKKYNSKSEGRRKVFYTFILPMLVLAARIEIELIYKNSYPDFFADAVQEKLALKMIND